MNLKSSLAGYFRCGLTRISPKLNAKVLQRVKTGKKLNMQHPATLSEKLVVLKLEQYNRDPLVKLCADKYRVRSYVEQCGYGGLLNELAAAYDSVEDIQWDQLPEQFAMKWNFGCGYNIICADKTALDIPAAIKTLKEWQKKRKRAYLNYAELQYKDVPPKIIVEKFLKGLHSSRPNDYKVYCFHGKPAAILLIADRTQDIHPGGFFDPE